MYYGNTYLSCPPPLARVHVEINLYRLICISIVAFGRKEEKGRELRISKEGLHAINNVTVKNLECLTCDDNLMLLKAGTYRG